jgi:hypothetical protein
LSTFQRAYDLIYKYYILLFDFSVWVDAVSEAVDIFIDAGQAQAVIRML